MRGVRATLEAATWRQWGFDLEAEDIAAIDRFFRTWFSIYNQPNIGAYRSQDALFGIHEVYRQLFGERLPDRQRRNAVSVLRAGYCVAATELALGHRRGVDPNLRKLFDAMEANDPSHVDEPLARAMRNGRFVGDVAKQMMQRDIAEDLPGFRLREAVFTDLTHTLFAKLKITALGSGFDDADSQLAMRLGHVVGVCEESLTETLPAPVRT